MKEEGSISITHTVTFLSNKVFGLMMKKYQENMSTFNHNTKLNYDVP
jgi:hypothetical protein